LRNFRGLISRRHDSVGALSVSRVLDVVETQTDLIRDGHVHV
jgi:hypothetical protein